MCPNHPHFLPLSGVDKQMDTKGSLLNTNHAGASENTSQINTLINSRGALQRGVEVFFGFFFFFSSSALRLCSLNSEGGPGVLGSDSGYVEAYASQL